MQMLHPHRGSIQQYMEQLDDPERGRPSHCPQCRIQEPMRAHGLYSRTIVDEAFDGVIRVRRYLCQACRRTVSLLPEWALPYVRFSIAAIRRTLKERLMDGRVWKAGESYQRAQQWVRRFEKQAEPLSAALTAVTPIQNASSFVLRAISMLEKTGWIAAHRFVFPDLRMHLLGWPPSLAPHGRRITVDAASSAAGSDPHTTCMEEGIHSG
jgi:transposase-like protein